MIHLRKFHSSIRKMLSLVWCCPWGFWSGISEKLKISFIFFWHFLPISPRNQSEFLLWDSAWTTSLLLSLNQKGYSPLSINCSNSSLDKKCCESDRNFMINSWLMLTKCSTVEKDLWIVKCNNILQCLFFFSEFLLISCLLGVLDSDSQHFLRLWCYFENIMVHTVYFYSFSYSVAPMTSDKTKPDNNVKFFWIQVE